MLPLDPAPRWTTHAECAAPGEDAEAWFNPARYDEARQVCRRCPVAASCLADIMAAERGTGAYHRWGIYAGLSPEQRVERDEWHANLACFDCGQPGVRQRPQQLYCPDCRDRRVREREARYDAKRKRGAA